MDTTSEPTDAQARDAYAAAGAFIRRFQDATAGRDIPEAARTLKVGGRWYLAGVSVDDAVEWTALGFMPGEAAPLIAAGVTPAAQRLIEEAQEAASGDDGAPVETVVSLADWPELDRAAIRATVVEQLAVYGLTDETSVSSAYASVLDHLTAWAAVRGYRLDLDALTVAGPSSRTVDRLLGEYAHQVRETAPRVAAWLAEHHPTLWQRARRETVVGISGYGPDED